jgi:hypothetical protein
LILANLVAIFIQGDIQNPMDFLQKSWCGIEFQVVDGRNQIETQAKAFWRSSALHSMDEVCFSWLMSGCSSANWPILGSQHRLKYKCIIDSRLRLKRRP